MTGSTVNTLLLPTANPTPINLSKVIISNSSIIPAHTPTHLSIARPVRPLLLLHNRPRIVTTKKIDTGAKIKVTRLPLPPRAVVNTASRALQHQNVTHERAASTLCEVHKTNPHTLPKATPTNPKINPPGNLATLNKFTKVIGKISHQPGIRAPTTLITIVNRDSTRVTTRKATSPTPRLVFKDWAPAPPPPDTHLQACEHLLGVLTMAKMMVSTPIIHTKVSRGTRTRT